MPTVSIVDGYRLFFYSSDRSEPFHIYVEKDGNTAKFWLFPIRLQASRGFSRKKINKILEIIEKNHEFIERRWNEYFNN